MPIRSATIPIAGENDQIIGLIYINLYMDLPLHSFFDSFMKLNGGDDSVVENFARNTDELIQTALEDAKTKVLNDSNITTSNKNKGQCQNEETQSLQQNKIRQSMDGKARLEDNVLIERWFSSFKCE